MQSWTDEVRGSYRVTPSSYGGISLIGNDAEIRFGADGASNGGSKAVFHTVSSESASIANQAFVNGW